MTHYDERRVIIDLCRRYGRAELYRLIDEIDTDDLLDALEAIGRGEDAVSWFRGVWPHEFYSEEPRDDAYLHEMELRLDYAKESAVMGGAYGQH